MKNISKRFGGLSAITDLSFSVRAGEIFGIIGPNGAGKSTLFNVLSSVYRQDSGIVKFQGKNLLSINKSHLVCRLGIGRTFQLVKPFDNITVLENVMVGAFCRHTKSSEASGFALDILDFLGMLDKKDAFGHTLTLADKKRLELARALATAPEVLLLDEVMAGLTAYEIGEAAELIKKIRDHGLTVLVVEHVMQAIMSLSNKVMVLAEGQKIMEGSPQEVIQDQRVIKAYLGKTMNLLNLENVSVRYGDVEVIRDLSLSVEEGSITSLVGSNGSGKSSLLKAVSGILPSNKGTIYFDEKNITGLPSHQRVELGLVQVPEGRHVFPYMSVMENLELGSILPKARAKRKENFPKVFDLFPRLSERSKQMARTLSGGEQQMLAVGRALMADRRLLMLDEPSLGLAPILVSEIFAVLAKINALGVTVLVVEQDVKASLELSRWGYVLENAHIVLSGDANRYIKSDRVRKAYLGL